MLCCHNNYYSVVFGVILEPAPQGMGAPQATDSTHGTDVETHRSLAGRSGFLFRVHLMPRKPSLSASSPPNPTHVGVWAAFSRTGNTPNCPMSSHKSNIKRFYVPTSSVDFPTQPHERHEPRTSFSDYLGTWLTFGRKCACGAKSKLTMACKSFQKVVATCVRAHRVLYRLSNMFF